MNSNYKLPNNLCLPKTLIPFFWYFVKQQPIAFAVFLFAPMVLILETNIIPYSLKMIIDAISAHQTDRSTIFQAVAPALWLGGSAWIGLVIIIRLQNWWQAYVIPRYQAQIRMTVFSYLTQHSYSYFANQLAGSLANKIDDLPRSMEAIRMVLSWNVIATFAAIIVALILMWFINVWFAVILLVWITVQSFVSIKFAHVINGYAQQNAENKSDLTGKIVDTLTNISAVKLFAQSHNEFDYVNQSQRNEIVSNKKLINATNLFRMCLDVPITIMLAVMVYLLIAFWQRDMISSGDVVFIFYSFFSIMNQMWYLSHSLMELFREIGVAKQALSLMAVPIEIVDKPDAKSLQVDQGRIEFEQVSFHYHQANRVFDNKSVVIEPQQRVGLVGYSGSGKTTFINLILRFFEVESGRILIDGQDISQVTQASLRANLSVIPQETILFHRSLLDNIGYGSPNASREQIIAAAQQAHCHEFIMKLPQGYDSLVGERGVKLSGGQRQRIAIARAILKKTAIFILDEATSQLDSITEESIQTSLFELMQGKTTLVIAHRLSTLLHMDRILVFDNGRIVEEGGHDQLLANNGLYKAMWDAQIGGFLPDNEDEQIIPIP